MVAKGIAVCDASDQSYLESFQLFHRFFFFNALKYFFELQRWEWSRPEIVEGDGGGGAGAAGKDKSTGGKKGEKGLSAAAGAGPASQ